MPRLPKALICGAIIEALLWVVGTSGPPTGLHVRIFGWGHFFPLLIGMHLGIPAAASPIGMSLIQICISTMLAYFVIASFDSHRAAQNGHKSQD
jgi:hypothetical protein